VRGGCCAQAIRETPLFSIVKSKVQQSTGEHAEAVKTLERARALPGVRQKAPRGGAAAAAGGGGGVVTQHERASVFVGLAQAQLKLNQLDAARDTIAEAKPLFMGSPQEMPVMIVDCDVAIARGDFRAAAARLAAIPKDSPHFVTAQTTLADVYLHQRNDKKKYIECYQALAANKPGARTSIALGEACMRVNEPQAAIRAYEAALEYNPSDGGLRSKVGKALVATHDYAQAKTYYEQALEEQPANTTLALELAQLAMRLGRRQRGQYEFAENVLLDAKAALGFDDSSAITNNVKVHLMLVRRCPLHGQRCRAESTRPRLPCLAIPSS
jgi:tetratricopeptide repeat protein 21B